MTKKNENTWFFGVIPPEKTADALKWAVDNPSDGIVIPRWICNAIQAEIAKQRVSTMSAEDHAKILSMNAVYSSVVKR